MSAHQKNKSTQTSGSVFGERIEKKIEFELKLIKILDGFFDGQRNYDGNLVSFNIKSLKQTIIFVTVNKSNDCSQRIQITW